MDLEPPLLSGWRAQYIRRGDLYTIGATFGRMKFDVVILNLMAQWIGNLDRFLDSLHSVLDSDARLLVTTTAPEFTRNVHWRDNGWRIGKRPERDRELTMINGVVGPVWLYPRSTAQYIETFARHRFVCVSAKNLYVDTYLTPSEKELVLRREPSLVRNTILPLFSAFEFQTVRCRRGVT
jgi:SAM-dependent methyltransferase